ncbi:MAG TPA: YceD family protein [Steroidobacteraceae bacterium]|nr:YceD family protein [Steroidobacteraceae bacterium]
MPRPPAVSNELLVDADVCARAGSTIERHFSVAELPRLREAGALDGSQVDVRLRFSLFDGRPAIDGALSGTMHLSCQRCMQPVAVPIDERFQVIVASAESAEEPGGYEPVVADAAHFDVRWLAEEQALLAMPLVPLHAAGECDEGAAPPDAEQGERAAVQKPFQNLRDLLEK